MAILLFFLEVGSRVSLVAALLTVAADSHLAAVVAIVASMATAARAFVRGELVMRALSRGWRELVAGVRSKTVSELASYREDEDGVAMMIDAVREVALLRATFVPEVAAQIASLGVITCLVVVRLSVVWLVAGVVLAALLGVVVLFTQRKQSEAQSRAYHALGGIARDARALVEAAPELRVQARESALATHLLSDSARMARDERGALRLSAAMGLGPSFVALAALALPAGALQLLSAQSSLIDLGVLGAAAISMALGLVHTLEGLARARPYRETFARVARPWSAPEDGTKPPPLEHIEVRDLGVRHATGARATPSGLSFSLERGGVALVGPNGSGKTTATLAVLGVQPPSSGSVQIDGATLDAALAAGLRAHVSYVPQRPYVSVGETLRWHARLVVDDDEAVLQRLGEIGLLDILRRRCPDDAAVLDLRMGTLSGGERQRFFIARALARPSRLLVLDEPEAGLDSATRARVRDLLGQASRDRLVLLVAHDVGVIPESFRQVTCAGEAIP